MTNGNYLFELNFNHVSSRLNSCQHVAVNIIVTKAVFINVLLLMKMRTKYFHLQHEINLSHLANESCMFSFLPPHNFFTSAE